MLGEGSRSRAESKHPMSAGSACGLRRHFQAGPLYSTLVLTAHAGNALQVQPCGYRNWAFDSRLHLAALSMTRALRVIALMSFSPSRLPREPSLRSHVKVDGVGILPSGADEHVSQAKLHK